MNNTGILQKCLDELSKEAPRLDYVRGMLETLIEMAGQEKVWSIPIEDAKKWVGSNGTIPEIDTPLPPMPDLNKIRAIATSEMI